MSESKSTLVLGPLKGFQTSQKIGGIVVLFENFIHWLSLEKIDFEVIDLNKSNYPNRFFSFFIILIKFARSQSKFNSVSLHGTARDFLYIAPIVVLFCKVVRKKIVLRKFAGSFDRVYYQSGFLKKILFKFVLKGASELHFESKHLVKFGKQFNPNTNWLPNVRNKVIQDFEPNIYNKKFLYLSHVSKDKGIEELLLAFKYLDQSYSLSIFGPCFDVIEEDLNSNNVKYFGTVDHSIVTDIISQHDVLILPSKRVDEGYPGIIIEAFSVGRPVIASNIGGIPEILQNQENGLLIEPGNFICLKEAILSINEDSYLNMCKNSFNSFGLFESKKVYNSLSYKLI